jgi:hypothetical protein
MVCLQEPQMITPAYGGGLGVGAEQVLPAGKLNAYVSLSHSPFPSPLFVHNVFVTSRDSSKDIELQHGSSYDANGCHSPCVKNNH